MPVGIVWGCVSLLASHGEFRLRHGVGRIASWEVAPAEWEEFRRFNAARAAKGANLPSGYAPRPSEGRSVKVMFGRRQVLVDDYYCRLHRFALPELIWVNWLNRPGEPECLEFGLLSASETSSVRTALRVPVPAIARAAGVQVFYHFQQAVPKRTVGLAFRRPWQILQHVAEGKSNRHAADTEQAEQVGRGDRGKRDGGDDQKHDERGDAAPDAPQHSGRAGGGLPPRRGAGDRGAYAAYQEQTEAEDH